MNKFQKWHDELHDLRREIGHDRYPIPDRQQGFEWASIEICGEAKDAHMELNGEWVRNTPDAKHSDPYRELAQGAMMVMLALGEDHQYSPDMNASSTATTINSIGFDAAFLPAANEGSILGISHTYVNICAETLIASIDVYCVGLDMHIEAEMQRLREKWLT